MRQDGSFGCVYIAKETPVQSPGLDTQPVDRISMHVNEARPSLALRIPSLPADTIFSELVLLLVIIYHAKC